MKYECKGVQEEEQMRVRFQAVEIDGNIEFVEVF
jgi:hypothetical protein